jgi:hypothetical protein
MTPADRVSRAEFSSVSRSRTPDGAVDGKASAADHREHDPAALVKRIQQLRADLRTRPDIARAVGLLQGRYRLADSETAFDLLRKSSQRFNLKLRALAAAFLTAPQPSDASGEAWFPGRVRPPAPVMTFSGDARQNHHNRATFLDVVLEAALECTATGQGDVQLVDPLHGGLQLETHRGFRSEFVDFFSYVEGEESACSVAILRGERVVVADVSTDPIFAGRASGRVLLQAGVRSLQSTPLVTPDGRAVGTMSTHHRERGQVPTPDQEEQLDLIAREAASWLDWHQNTVVLDALEHLHRSAQ